MVKTYRGSSPEIINVGRIIEDIYVTIRLPEHFFRIFQGFGLSIKIYNDLVREDVKRILIKYIGIEGNEYFLSDLKKWEKGMRWDNKLYSNEIDPQYVLPIKEMTKLNEWRIDQMDLSEYTKAQGMFLKAQDVIENPEAVFVIKNEGEMVTSEKFGTTRLHLQGEFAGEEKTFDVSKTNARFIEEKLGSDTKKWVGKILVLETYRTKTSDGKMVDALNVKEVKKDPDEPETVKIK